MISPKKVIGKYIHRGIMGTFNYEKSEKIVHAYRRNGDLHVRTEEGNTYTYMDSIDLINNNKELW